MDSNTSEFASRLVRAYDYTRSIGAIHTKKEFAQAIGWRPTHLSSAFGGDPARLTQGLMVSIAEAFPYFSSEWLLTGEGEMLCDEVDSEEEDKFLDMPAEYVTYLVPIAAMGGSLSGFEETGVMLRDCEKIISPIAGVDLAIPVCGDSMEPEYPNGSQVLVKRIYPDDFIAWGNVFVLDTTNGVIIKVVKRSDDERCVTCESLNPSGRYQPFDVPKRSIRAMYRVLMCVSLK